jgi:hypothetical protein
MSAFNDGAAAQYSNSCTKPDMPFKVTYRPGLRRELYDLCIQDDTTFELTVNPKTSSNRCVFYVEFAGSTKLAHIVIALLAGNDASLLESMDQCLVCVVNFQFDIPFPFTVTEAFDEVICIYAYYRPLSQMHRGRLKL